MYAILSVAVPAATDSAASVLLHTLLDLPLFQSTTDRNQVVSVTLAASNRSWPCWLADPGALAQDASLYATTVVETSIGIGRKTIPESALSLTNCSASYRPCRFPYVTSFPALLSDTVLAISNRHCPANHWRQPLSDLNPGQSWCEPNFWSLFVTSLAHVSPYTLPVTSYSPLWKI